MQKIAEKGEHKSLSVPFNPDEQWSRGTGNLNFQNMVRKYFGREYNGTIVVEGSSATHEENEGLRRWFCGRDMILCSYADRANHVFCFAKRLFFGQPPNVPVAVPLTSRCGYFKFPVNHFFCFAFARRVLYVR